jgi:hypothetical protein
MRARADCRELCKRRVELELLLLGSSIGFERCVRMCEAFRDPPTLIAVR